MITNIKPDENFNPFDLIIRVETKEDAQHLWCRFNTPHADLYIGDECPLPDSSESDSLSAWQVLNNYMQLHNLKS